MKTNFLLISYLLISICIQVSFAMGHQETWRWRNDDGDVYTATWKDSLNHPIVITNYDNIRLRIGFYHTHHDSSNLSLRYSENPGISPWIPITNIDTGKFFISSSQYLTDRMPYSNNQLLPPDSEYSYVKSVTFDSTNNYLLITDDNSKYELEYSLKPTSKIQHGSAYFFTLFRNTSLISDPTVDNRASYDYAVLMVPPINWNTQNSGTTEDLEDICIADSNKGWAVGSNGKILKTTNDGVSWNSQISGTLMDLYAVSFTDVDNGWIVGSDNEQDHGAIYRTTDGGKTWTLQKFYTEQIFRGVNFVNVKTGWVAGVNTTNNNANIYKTTNGGESWSLQSIADSIADYDLSDIFFTDENNGVAVGGGGYQYSDWGYILRTTNGGEKWTPQLNEHEFHFLKSVFFIDAKNGWTVGGVNLGFYETSVILRTTDGGETWTEQPSGTSHPLYGVFFSDANNGCVVGKGGTILRTSDGGNTWATQTSGSSIRLNAVSFSEENYGVVVGYNGKILRTTIGSVTSVADNRNYKVPSHYLLSQNYPNPFNPTTTINYSIPKQSLVTLKIYDIIGRQIATLVNAEKLAGNYEVNFKASNLASGVYFYRIKAGNFVQTKKMILLR